MIPEPSPRVGASGLGSAAKAIPGSAKVMAARLRQREDSFWMVNFSMSVSVWVS